MSISRKDMLDKAIGVFLENDRRLAAHALMMGDTYINSVVSERNCGRRILRSEQPFNPIRNPCMKIAFYREMGFENQAYNLSSGDLLLPWDELLERLYDGATYKRTKAG